MPSPDATPYVDLTVYDKDAQEMFESAITNLAAYLEDWVPREGQTEVLLLESMALQVSEAVFAINRVPGAVVQVLLQLYGIERDPGTPPTVGLTFTLGDASGYTIPEGTRVAVPIGSSEETVVFVTDDATVSAVGSYTTTVTATAETATAVLNGTPTGSPVELLDALSSVDRVDITTAVAGGTNPEDDLDWFTRGAQRFARLAEALVLPRHFVSAALERPQVQRAFAVDNYNPNAGSGTAGSHPGYVAVAVYGVDGPLSAATKTAMAADFDAQAQANLAVNVIDPTINTVNVTASVVGQLGYSTDQVVELCRKALADYLSPLTWGWAATLYRNDLIGLLSRVEGVARVTSVTAPANDVVLTGVAPLTQLGTTNITVTGL